MKKLFISLIMALTLALTFSLVVLADSVHNENTVDYDATVTLDDGTVCPLFDSEGNSLIWYISGTEDGKNVYSSIRADDSRVHWNTESWNEVTSVGIHLDDGTTYSSSTFVVVNMMDDDVISNTPIGNHTNYGTPIRGFKYVFRGLKNLEYVYLRLDTQGFYRESFNNCPKLKYVNLENLTQLKRIGDSYNFAGCTSLFKGQVLDLSKTKLTAIDWNNSFTGVPMVGIKLPSTLTTLGDSFKNTALVTFTLPEKITVLNSNMFYGCVDLETVTLSSGLTGVIAKNAFYGCTSLTTVYYVGTLEELNALLDRTEEGNDAFLAVAGENRENLISYADYLALEDKSGKYMVYNYSWCEAYNDGNHEITGTNPCVGFCSVCQNNIIKHAEDAETVISVEYVNYGEAGLKITTCANEGCTYKVTEELDALITCRGFSAPENGEGVVTVGYVVNYDAIAEYTSLTGEAVKFGMFAALKATLGENELIGENGEIIDGVISAEMPENKFSLLNLKVFGFNTDDQKNSEFTIGAYVVTSGEGTSRVDYVQDKKFESGNKYTYVSYNTVYETLYPSKEQ